MTTQFFRISLFTVLLVCVCTLASAQKQDNIWYFGQAAGLDFNSGSPVAITNCNTSFNAPEGCATVSDPVTGALLFYTNSIRVWDKTHTQMANGFGLLGGPSSTQAALIVPRPGSNTIYYIFTTDNNGLNYSTVDMSLNSGNGDVSTKNTNLAAFTMEKLTGLRHSNCSDYWVIDHDNSNTIRAWLVTSAGVSTTPVISNIGITPVAFGVLKGSNKSQKLAMTSYNGTTNNTQLFDFNNTTGVVSNPKLISNNIFNPYTVAFAPNDSLFYISYNGGINQYETYAANIPATEVKVANVSGLATIELAPDCKIYCVPTYGSNNLGVINNPKVKTNPGYVANALSLAGKLNTNGLPNSISRDRTFAANFGFITTACSLLVQFNDSSSKCVSGPSAWSWNFGDGTTSTSQNPNHTYPSSGTYNVKLLVTSMCMKDSITKTVTISSGLSAGAAVNNNISCTGGILGSATMTVNGGIGTYTYSWSGGQTSATATGLSAGTYSVSVSDSVGCTSTSSVQIVGAAGPSLAASFVNPQCFGGIGSATASASGGTGAYSYSWSSGQTSASVTGLLAGAYTVTVTDSNGCSLSSLVTILQPNQLIVTAGPSNNNFCIGQGGSISTTVSGGTGTYTYSWSTAQTTSSISVTPSVSTNYTVHVTDANGCSDSSVVSITVNALPVVAFAVNDTAGCAALCVNFLNFSSPSGSTYLWKFGDGDSSTVMNPAHCYTVPGTYSVTLTVTSPAGCVNSYTCNNMIDVYPNPVANFSMNPNAATTLNPTIQFTDLSIGSTSWQWYFGDQGNSSSIMQNPSFTYKDSGSYKVTLIVTNGYGCSDTIQDQLLIKNEYAIYVPNAFTPDGDGLNDTFFPKGVGLDPDNFHMMIFDRWGDLIFETDNLNKGWDGRANDGKEVAQIDVYVWKIKTADNYHNMKNYIGKVSLVK